LCRRFSLFRAVHGFLTGQRHCRPSGDKPLAAKKIPAKMRRI
jgi:hypothetical protein